MTRTAADCAASFQLFAEYIDPDATTSREAWEAMTINQRIAICQEVIDANLQPPIKMGRPWPADYQKKDVKVVAVRIEGQARREKLRRLGRAWLEKSIDSAQDAT